MSPKEQARQTLAPLAQQAGLLLLRMALFDKEIKETDKKIAEAGVTNSLLPPSAFSPEKIRLAQARFEQEKNVLLAKKADLQMRLDDPINQMESKVGLLDALDESAWLPLQPTH